MDVRVDQNAHQEQYRDYSSGDNNYIEVVKKASPDSRVYPSMNTGMWETPSQNHDDAPHEFGHLLGLRDRYGLYSSSDGKRHSIPNSGWDGNIMAEHEGKVEQRNIDAIFKGCKIESTTDWKKNRTHHERK